MNNKLKILSLVSLLLLATNKCIQESQKTYSWEIMNTLALKKNLSKDHNILVAWFMAHIKALHTNFYQWEDVNISVGEWILHMNTSLSTREYAVAHFKTPDSLACKFIWDNETDKIWWVWWIINGDEYDVNAAALYFDQLIFGQQLKLEKQLKIEAQNQMNLFI